MTALRIFATSRPSLIGARVEPMSKEDEQFWELLRARRAKRVSGSGEAVRKLRSVGA